MIGIYGETGSIIQSVMYSTLMVETRGPLVFSLLLSLLLSIAARTQKDAVFTGVFALVWIGSTVVTWQIRLLGGKM